MSLTLMMRFLDAHEVQYVNSGGSHMASGSMEAQVGDLPARVLVRNVILSIDGALAMALIPAGHELRLDFLKDVMEADSVAVAELRELMEAFPECDPEAIPPFGVLQSMRVFCSDALRRSTRMAFYAGTRSRMVEMGFSDYVRLVRPLVLPISESVARQAEPLVGGEWSAVPGRDRQRRAEQWGSHRPKEVMPEPM